MGLRISMGATAAVFILGAAQAVSPEVVVLDSGIGEAQVTERPWRAYAAECADMLIQHGTDRYGEEHLPLLVTILDVRTRECPEDPPREPPYWRGDFRDCFWKPRGSDFFTDQATLECLHLLTRLTGEEHYARFAERYLGAAMRMTDRRGFFWWGWHRFYDVFDDTREAPNGDHHEIHVVRPRWEMLWRVNPEAARTELKAIQQWHLINPETGEHNRHGDGKRGCDFAMSGGEFIYALAWLHQKTGAASALEDARLIANYHWNARNRETHLTPNRPNAGTDRFDGTHFDTSITGVLCYYLLKTHELTGENLFRDQAIAYLKAYDRYGYDEATGKFWGSLKLDGTPVPGPRTRGDYAQYEPRGHIELWEPYQLGYEFAIYTAQCYAYAYQVSKDPELLDAARKWAACIRAHPPTAGCRRGAWFDGYARACAEHGAYAGPYGRTISFFLHLYALTGEADFLQDARTFGREAVSRLYYRGLFRGHPAKPFYSSVDGVGYLLYALLQLDQVDRAPEACIEQPGIPMEDGGTLPFDNW